MPHVAPLVAWPPVPSPLHSRSATPPPTSTSVLIPSLHRSHLGTRTQHHLVVQALCPSGQGSGREAREVPRRKRVDVGWTTPDIWRPGPLRWAGPGWAFPPRTVILGKLTLTWDGAVPPRQRPGSPLQGQGAQHSWWMPGPAQPSPAAEPPGQAPQRNDQS